MKALPIIVLTGALIMVWLNVERLPIVSVFKNNHKFDALFEKYGKLYNISPFILKAIATQESSLNPNAKASTTSALGLMQVTQTAAKDVNERYENQTDPETSIKTGAKYLRYIMDNFRLSLTDTVRAYYAGMGTVLKANKDPKSLLGAQKDQYAYSAIYLQKVMGYANSYMVA